MGVGLSPGKMWWQSAGIPWRGCQLLIWELVVVVLVPQRPQLVKPL